METTSKETLAIIASSVTNAVMELIPDLVQHRLDVVQKQEEAPPPVRWPSRPMFGRTSIYSPQSNYTEVFMASVRWRSKKGERLGYAKLIKPGTTKTLFVEQYGLECSMLERDDSVPKAIWESGACVKPGMSPWTRFESVQRTLSDVIQRLIEKDWKVVNNEVSKPVQLALEPMGS